MSEKITNKRLAVIWHKKGGRFDGKKTFEKLSLIDQKCLDMTDGTALANTNSQPIS